MAAARESRGHEVDSAEARYLHFLVRAGEILGLSLDYHQTLQNVCAAAVETVADMCLLFLGSGTQIELVASAHRVPGMNRRLSAAGTYLHRGDGQPRHAICEVIETGLPLFAPEITPEYIERFATGRDHAQFMRDMEYRSMIVVPVISQVQGILGALTLIRTDSDALYDERALLFAEDLGRRFGTAISKSKLYSQSVEVATRLQITSLPRTLPARPGLTLDAYYEPAESQMLIGGDWYDAFNLPDGRLGISVGDVTGHGYDAAAFMGTLRDALRTALYGDVELLRALDIADYLIREEFPDGRNATAQLAIYDPDKRILRGAAAGHPGPLIWMPESNSVIDPFVDRGLPLGMRDLRPDNRQSCSVTLGSGAMAVYFTDGLVEWKRDYIEGEAALRAAMMDPEIRNAAHPARLLRRAVVSGKHEDDIALLVLRVT